MRGTHIERARMLISRNRHALAEEQLSLAMAEDPENPLALLLLALCLTKREAFAEASNAAELAVRCGPDNSYAHYMRAHVFCERHMYPEARRAIRDSLRIESANPLYHALAGRIEFNSENWSDALAAAEQGLACNPQDEQCVNLRALSLLQLGQAAQADSIAVSAISRTPEDAATHNTRGWTLLMQGQTIPALDHFRAALHIDPTLDGARQGMVQALKARFWPYRVLLLFSYRANKVAVSWRGALGVICLLLLISVVSVAGLTSTVGSLAIQHEYFLTVVSTLVAAYVYSLWAMAPLSDMLLHFHPDGRLALSPEQHSAARWSSWLLFASAITLVLSVLGRAASWNSLTLTCLLLTRNVHATLIVVPRARRVVHGTVVALATLSVLLGAIGIALARHAHSPVFNSTGLQRSNLIFVVVGIITLCVLPTVVNRSRYKR